MAVKVELSHETIDWGFTAADLLLKAVQERRAEFQNN
jgi:hypothetical protein